MITEKRTKMAVSVIGYIPNLIGYLRILFTFAAALLIFHLPLWAIVLGSVSQILDAVDGALARWFGQCSALGAILDYTIDRMFVGCWMIVLTVLFPRLWLLFMFILSFDLMSHLFHLYASMQQGKINHKEPDGHQSVLLRFYYSNRLFMFLVCLFHDLWILAMIVYYFYPSHAALIAVFICTPFMLFKGYIHSIQLISAARYLVHFHKREPDAH